MTASTVQLPDLPLTAFSALSLQGCGRGGGHQHVGDWEGGEVVEPLAEVDGRAWQVGAYGAQCGGVR